MAAPHVSRIAALILSRNPNLTRQQVNTIIESTAQKVGGYPYAYTSGHHNGTWYEQVGYGLVNAYAAVQAACTTPVNFTNKTVTTNQTITSCSDVNMENVTVTNAKLTVNTPKNVYITGPFSVEYGSFEVEIK